MLPIALIVDRDADTRSMYADYLRLESRDSEEAADGRDAFVKALTRRHDVIVTETRLRFISGYDLCRLLKHHRTTAGIRSSSSLAMSSTRISTVHIGPGPTSC